MNRGEVYAGGTHNPDGSGTMRGVTSGDHHDDEPANLENGQHHRGRSRRPDLSPERLEDQQRAHEAVRLRIEGKGWEEIARACGYYDRGTAHRAVDRLVKSYPAEDVDTLRQLNIDRLMTLVIAPNALRAQGFNPDGSPREKGPDLWAQQRIIDAVDRIAKWTGTDGPAPLPPAGETERRTQPAGDRTMRDIAREDPHRARELARFLDSWVPKRPQGPADPVVIEHGDPS